MITRLASLHLSLRRWVGASLAATLWLSQTVYAADYPTKTVTLVVPTPSGGTVDTTARLVAAELRTKLSRPVVVDNRPGAAGLLASQFVARAPADGHTLLFTLTSHLTNPVLNLKSGYDPIKDFAPVSLLITSGAVVTVNSNQTIGSWDDFLRIGRSNRGVSFGHWGMGSSTHFYTAMIEDAARLKLTSVPYKGEAPVVTDLLGSSLDAGLVSINTFRGLARAGKVKGLAVTLGQRSPAVPDLPTLAELGIPGPGRLNGWFGVLAPAGTPPEIVNRLSQVLADYMKQADVRERLINEFAFTPVGSTPEAFDKLLKTEFAEWKKAATTYGIKAE